MVLLKNNITKRVDGLVYEIPARPVMVEGSEEYMPIIKFVGTTVKNADGILQPKADAPGRPAVSIATAKPWLRDFLSEGPKNASEVFKAGDELENFSVATIKRAKAELHIMSTKDGKGWMWSLLAPDSNAIVLDSSNQ
jgi:hypothetical protein